MKDTLLITGGSGLLGVNWALALRDEYNVILGIHNRRIRLEGIESRQFNLESVKSLVRDLKAVTPDIVIHTTGLTDVEACEKNPRLASFVNTDLAENVALACARMKLPLVHISTDHLFSGTSSLVDENQPLAPQNVYAQTKAAAESKVLDAHPQTLVVRTNFYGWGTTYRRSFSDVIVNTLRKNRSLTLFQDVFYTPILIGVLVDAVHHLVNANLSGIYHIVGDERLSKYQFGLKLAEEFNLNTRLILAGKLIDQNELSKRPMEMSLSNKKVCEQLGINLGNVDQHLHLLSAQLETGIAKEILAL